MPRMPIPTLPTEAPDPRTYEERLDALAPPPRPAGKRLEIVVGLLATGFVGIFMTLHDGTLWWTFLTVLFTLYFVPTTVATWRGHPQHLAISVLNLLAGWTLIGWIGSLVWACTNPGATMPQDDTYHRAP